MSTLDRSLAALATAALTVAGLTVAGLTLTGCESGSGDPGAAVQAPSATMDARSRPLGRGALAPEQEFNTEAYDRLDENQFLSPRDQALSTFSIDVDTASYANIRRFLVDGTLPPPDAVRIEEMVNYFSYQYPEPDGDAPFSVSAEVAGCPWQPKHRLVRIGLQTSHLDSADVPPRNLVFLLDVSGSMNSPDKLGLLKRALPLLVDTLRPQDTVSMVVYAGASGVVLPPTDGQDGATIRAAIERLSAGGSTNGGEGIQLAYKLARENFREDAINRVILATDGDFNVGVTNRGDLTRLIEKEREHGVFLTVLGFGTGNLKDSQMEEIADRGNGNYHYIDTISEARKVLVQEAGGTLVTVAKDVKIQVDFNPANVEAFRLIGYENRMLEARDFNDDKKDAGEIGAGHSVTALYEVVPPGAGTLEKEVDDLRYQTGRNPTPAANSSEMMTVKLRYKEPRGTESQLLSYTINDNENAWQSASGDFRFAASVAAFGMVLRKSELRGAADYDLVRALARDSLGQDTFGYRAEFVKLVADAAATH
jgi:Ca-activated chloride channel family protein